MASGTDFLLEIEQRLTGDDIVGELAGIERELVKAQDRLLGFEKDALSAAKGLEKVGGQLEAARSKMQSAMTAGDEKTFWKAAAAADALAKKEAELKDKATAAAAAFDKEAKAITAMSDRMSVLAKKEAAEQASAKKASDRIEQTATGFKKLGGPLGKIGNVVEDVSESYKMFEEKLGSTGAIAALGAAGLAVLAAAVVAVAAAFVAGAVAAAAWVVKLSDARRETQLTIEGVQLADGELTNLSSTIDQVQRTTGQGTDKLLDMTQQLREAGVAAGDLPEALLAASQIDVGNPKATSKWISDLKDGKKSLADLTAEGSKFTDLVGKKQLGLNAQYERFQRNISDIFSLDKMEGFLTGLSRLVDLFDKNTASGQALRAIFETLFGPLGDSDAIFIGIERWFLKLEIAALKAGIKIKEMFKDVDTGPLKEMWELLSPTVVAGMEGALSAYVEGWVAFIQAIVWVTEAFTTAWEWGKSLGDIISELVTNTSDFVDRFKGIGEEIINGLVDAITNGAERVAGAVSDMAGQAIDAAKKKLKIGSPSKVFFDMGENVDESFAGGVSANDAAGAALEELVEAPAPQGASSGRGGDRTVIIQHLEVNGVERAEDIAPSVADQVADILFGESIDGATEAA